MEKPRSIDYPDYLEYYRKRVSDLEHENITLHLTVERLKEYAAYLKQQVEQEDS